MLSIVKKSIGLKNGQSDMEGTLVNGTGCSASLKKKVQAANRGRMGKPLFMFSGHLENFALQWGGVRGCMKNKRTGFICEKMDLMSERERGIEARLKNLLDKIEMMSAYAIREEILAKVDTRLLTMECVLNSGGTCTIKETEDDLKYCHRLLHGDDCDCRLAFAVRQDFGHLELPLFDVNVFEC